MHIVKIILYFFLLMKLGLCLSAGKCNVEVSINADVDVEATNGQGQMLATLRRSSRVVSPFQCITECCEDGACTTVTYRLSSENGDSNCYQYICRNYHCPTKPTTKRYVYKLVPQSKDETPVKSSQSTSVSPPIAPMENTSWSSSLSAGGGYVQTQTVGFTNPLRDMTSVESSESVQATVALTTRPGEVYSTITTNTETTARDISKTSKKFLTEITSTTIASATQTSPELFTKEGTKTAATSTADGHLKTAGRTDFKETTTYHSILRRSYGILVTFAAFGFMILIATACVLSNRVYESMRNYRYRNYSKVQYLINDRRLFA